MVQEQLFPAFVQIFDPEVKHFY